MDPSRKRRRLLALLPAAAEAVRRDANMLSRATLAGCNWGDAELIGRIYFDHAGEARPSDLLGLAYTTSAGVTGSLRRLEDAGFIERKRIESDGRVILVRITDLGREAVYAALPEFDALAKERFGELSDEEIDLIYRFCQRQIEA